MWKYLRKYTLYAVVLVAGVIIGKLLFVNPTDGIEISGQYKNILSEVNGDKAVLLDVRSLAEYEDSHVAGAKNRDVERLKADDFPDEKSIKYYLYCRSGNRSEEAALLMTGAGFETVVDLGGLGEMYDLGAVFERTQVQTLEIASQGLKVTSLPILGDDDAEVEIIEIIDYLCPYCVRHALEVRPALVAAYVDTGKAYVTHQIAAYRGADSVSVASAAFCTAEQNKYWEYSDLLAQAFVGQRDITEYSVLKELANETGIDTSLFEECYLSGRYVPLVRASTKHFSDQEIKGTPTFVINGKAVFGAIPLDDFKQIIDENIAI